MLIHRLVEFQMQQRPVAKHRAGRVSCAVRHGLQGLSQGENMNRICTITIPCLVMLVLASLPARAEDFKPPYLEPSDWTYEGPDGSRHRTTAAKDAKTETVKKMFAAAGVSYPPEQLFFRVFKLENVLEVWAASKSKGPLTHVATYEICYKSGKLGPKRRTGDQQVPEGFYHLDYYNKHSAFYLSMRISYPNRSDKILGHRKPGSAIMIHGNCVSIGCLAMSDERIQELWLMTRTMADRKRKVFVHAFPARDFGKLLANPLYIGHHNFWKNLQEGYEIFMTSRILPRVSIDKKGTYLFREGQ